MSRRWTVRDWVSWKSPAGKTRYIKCYEIIIGVICWLVGAILKVASVSDQIYSSQITLRIQHATNGGAHASSFVIYDKFKSISANQFNFSVWEVWGCFIRGHRDSKFESLKLKRQTQQRLPRSSLKFRFEIDVSSSIFLRPLGSFDMEMAAP